MSPLIRRGSLIAQKYPQVPGGEDDGSDWLIDRARWPTLAMWELMSKRPFFLFFFELKLTNLL